MNGNAAHPAGDATWGVLHSPGTTSFRLTESSTKPCDPTGPHDVARRYFS